MRNRGVVLGVPVVLIMLCLLLACSTGAAATEAVFEDVPAKHWAFSYIEDVVSRNLFQGTGASKFEPETTMTRAMFVTVLARNAGMATGQDVVSPFADVPSGQWYSNAIDWAKQQNLLDDLAQGGNFYPSQPIQREEMMVLLHRYLKTLNFSMPETTAETTFTPYIDAEKISAYAQEAVAEGRKWEIMEGFQDGSFQPQATSTRAQVAAVFSRLGQLLQKGIAPEETPLSGLFTITFATGSGSQVASQSIAAGEKVTKPADPTRSGYTFAGWYADQALTQAYDFNAEVKESHTVYAKWTTQAGGGGGGGGGSTSSNNVSVTGITLPESAKSLYTGESYQLRPSIQPANATNQQVAYSTSNPAVASVDANGLVQAVAPGEAIITATTAQNGKTATCQVTVAEKTVALTNVRLTEQDNQIIAEWELEGAADLVDVWGIYVELESGIYYNRPLEPFILYQGAANGNVPSSLDITLMLVRIIQAHSEVNCKISIFLLQEGEDESGKLTEWSERDITGYILDMVSAGDVYLTDSIDWDNCITSVIPEDGTLTFTEPLPAGLYHYFGGKLTELEGEWFFEGSEEKLYQQWRASDRITLGTISTPLVEDVALSRIETTVRENNLAVHYTYYQPFNIENGANSPMYDVKNARLVLDEYGNLCARWQLPVLGGATGFTVGAWKFNPSKNYIIEPVGLDEVKSGPDGLYYEHDDILSWFVGRRTENAAQQQVLNIAIETGGWPDRGWDKGWVTAGQVQVNYEGAVLPAIHAVDREAGSITLAEEVEAGIYYVTAVDASNHHQAEYLCVLTEASNVITLHEKYGGFSPNSNWDYMIYLQSVEVEQDADDVYQITISPCQEQAFVID